MSMETKVWPSFYGEDEWFFLHIIESKKVPESHYEKQEEIGRVLGTQALLFLQMFHFVLHMIFMYI